MLYPGKSLRIFKAVILMVEDITTINRQINYCVLGAVM